MSATPRHVLCVTDNGECWTNEEGKVLLDIYEIIGLLANFVGMEESFS